jgi:ribosomal RNA-processing protein 8
LFCIFFLYQKKSNILTSCRGILKIAEVESRFTHLENFISLFKKVGFDCLLSNTSYKMFVFLEFKKVKREGKWEVTSLDKALLKPCIYKKR